jgi:hypothetical protein
MIMEGTLRYARSADLNTVLLDRYPNFHHITVARDGTRAVLESGINAMRQVSAPDGSRGLRSC